MVSIENDAMTETGYISLNFIRVWRVRYNSFHDQLVLTSGSDSRVVLHALPSISSEPKGHMVYTEDDDDVATNTEEKESSPPTKEQTYVFTIYNATT